MLPSRRLPIYISFQYLSVVIACLHQDDSIKLLLVLIGERSISVYGREFLYLILGNRDGLPSIRRDPRNRVKIYFVASRILRYLFWTRESLFGPIIEA